MRDRRISRTHTENVPSSCVTPVYMNALETMTLTETMRRSRFGKNNLVWIIVGVTRADKQEKMDERSWLQ